MTEEQAKLQATIKRLREVILDPNCKQMNKSTVVGFLAEVLVREKLISEGLEVKHAGNQAGHDLEVLHGPKIDVKSCTLKPFYTQTDCVFWGWALLSDTKRRKISFSNIVCVAFDSKLEVDFYFVINVDDLDHFPPAIKRYRGVLRTLNVFNGVPVFGKKADWPEIHEKCELAIRNGFAVRVSPNGSIAEVLRRSRKP